jgi:hypothetical protein
MIILYISMSFRAFNRNVVFNLKCRIPLLFYCVKHIHRQFLKLRNIHFKQIAETISHCMLGKTCNTINSDSNREQAENSFISQFDILFVN